MSFFQTQPIFDVEKFFKFLKQAQIPVPILAGVVFLKSPRMAYYMRDHIPQVTIPGEFIKRIEGAKDCKQEAKDIASKIINDLKDITAGIHFMPFGWYQELGEIL